MSLILSRFQDIFPDFKEIREQHILNSNSVEVGWNSVILTQDTEVISAGTHEIKETARRIAIAEAIERKIVGLLAANNDKSFLMNEIPSSSGCAVGFEDFSTRARALFEGVERWIWSQWIDYEYSITPIEFSKIVLTPLAQNYYEKFDSVLFLHKEFNIDPKWLGVDKLQFGAVLGISGNGIYAGSRVSMIGDDLWTHGLVEAWRNYVIANLNPNGHQPSAILNRIIFFSRNKDIALAQIGKATKFEWPELKIRVLKSYKIKDNDPFYFWRSLCFDFVPWHLGDEKRFVY